MHNKYCNLWPGTSPRFLAPKTLREELGDKFCTTVQFGFGQIPGGWRRACLGRAPLGKKQTSHASSLYLRAHERNQVHQRWFLGARTSSKQCQHWQTKSSGGCRCLSPGHTSHVPYTDHSSAVKRIYWSAEATLEFTAQPEGQHLQTLEHNSGAQGRTRSWTPRSLCIPSNSDILWACEAVPCKVCISLQSS